MTSGRPKRKYAVCGLSARAIHMYVEPMLTTFSERCEVVGLLDKDPLRFVICTDRCPSAAAVPTYTDAQLERMIEETGPDTMIVTSTDCTHAHYIVEALRHDLDVISEKPMATTAADCRRILQAESESRGKVILTFNYRYTPVHRRIKELMLEGRVGRVTSVDLNWYIDTRHGSSYFMRWNRLRASSGGLSVHKCCHHFDLVNWWVDQTPESVYALGALNYYGPESEHNPEKEDGRHCAGCPVREKCPYVMRWSTRTDVLGHGSGESAADTRYTGYSPDACIYDSEIDVEDTYVAAVRYSGGAFLSYSALFSCPYEGYRLAINGTRGRLESQEYHAPGRVPFPVPVQTIDYFPLFGSKETIHVVHSEGGHGGGDPLLLEDLFLGRDPQRPYSILAGASAGSYAVAIGEAVWRSAKEGRPVNVTDLLGGKETGGEASGGKSRPPGGEPRNESRR